jgi:hypothetical protein
MADRPLRSFSTRFSQHTRAITCALVEPSASTTPDPSMNLCNVRRFDPGSTMGEWSLVKGRLSSRRLAHPGMLGCILSRKGFPYAR